MELIKNVKTKSKRQRLNLKKINLSKNENLLEQRRSLLLIKLKVDIKWLDPRNDQLKKKKITGK